MCIECCSQDNHGNSHHQRTDNHQRTAAELIDRKDCQHSERQVHGPYHNLLQQSGIGSSSHRLKYLRCIIKHYVDTDKLLESGQQDTYHNNKYTVGTNRERQRNEETADQGNLQGTCISRQLQSSVGQQE